MLEVEKHNTIAFLDVLVIRDVDAIKINWYTKPTSSGVIIRYEPPSKPKKLS